MWPSPACASTTAGAPAGCTPRRSARSPAAQAAYRTDGTFGVTGDCPDIDPDLVEAVENHRFEPVAAAEWRNARLDFQSLGALQRSLAAPPPAPGLKRAREALDEMVLRQLAADETVRARCRNRDNLFALWDVCQTPDFRKTSMEEHLRLVRMIFDHLTEGPRRLSDDWIGGQFASLDRLDGDIDALAGRPRPRAHPGLCRQPAELAARSRPTGRAARASWRTASPTPCTSG